MVSYPMMSFKVSIKIKGILGLVLTVGDLQPYVYFIFWGNLFYDCGMNWKLFWDYFGMNV